MDCGTDFDCQGRERSRVAWNRGSARGHVAYVILLGLLMEYLGPSMTAPPSHVTEKNSIFGQKLPPSYNSRHVTHAVSIQVT